MKAILKNLYHRAREIFTDADVINAGERGIINFIDISSNDTLTPPWQQNARLIQHLLRFAPHDRATQSTHITTASVPLWSTNTEREQYLYEGNDGKHTSMFKQNYDYVRQHADTLARRGDPRLAQIGMEPLKLLRTDILRCRALDDVLYEFQSAREYHFMKIDAQGTEYEILRGAEHLLLTTCVGLHLTLFTVPLYIGVKLLPEVETYLAKFDFELVHQTPPYGRFASQHDCVFIKKTSPNKAAVQAIRRVYEV